MIIENISRKNSLILNKGSLSLKGLSRAFSEKAKDDMSESDRYSNLSHFSYLSDT